MTPYRRLLVAYDGSEGSRIAAIHAAILARRLDAQLRALWVRSRLPHYPETIDEIDEEEGAAHKFFEKIEADLQRICNEHRIEIQSEMRSGHPARTIVEAASNLDIDLIILGNRGHSRLWGGFLGHTANRVSEYAPCSVLIVRSQEESAQFRKILIGYDGSPGAELALRHSILLAKQLGSEVHVIWVHQSPGRVSDTTKKKAENDAAEQHFKEHFLPQIKTLGEASDIRVHSMFKVGNVSQSIISEAERGGFRIVALGHRGSSGIWGRFLGGVADRVSDQAHCDVLIVRQLS